MKLKQPAPYSEILFGYVKKDPLMYKIAIVNACIVKYNVLNVL